MSAQKQQPSSEKRAWIARATTTCNIVYAASARQPHVKGCKGNVHAGRICGMQWNHTNADNNYPMRFTHAVNRVSHHF